MHARARSFIQLTGGLLLRANLASLLTVPQNWEHTSVGSFVPTWCGMRERRILTSGLLVYDGYTKH